jgi:hypothetical protein
MVANISLAYFFNGGIINANEHVIQISPLCSFPTVTLLQDVAMIL